MKLIKYSISATIVLLLATFVTPSNASNCEHVNNNSSKVISTNTQHCLSLPLSTNEPLVIVQAESGGHLHNKFKVEVLASNSANASVLESFVSSGMSIINTASSTTQKAIATVRVKPVGEFYTSKIKIIYANIEGLDTLIIFNKNIPNLPIHTSPPTECLVQPRRQFCDSQNSSYSIREDSNFSIIQNSTSSCNINNSAPTMPTSFDLNESLKDAELYKLKISEQISSISEHGDAFEKRNISILEKTLKYTWAFNLMNDGHPLDLKAHFGTGTQYEDFGNFHYAAYLTAAGFSRSEILSGASFNQAWKDNGRDWDAAWEAFKGWFTQDQDHAHDTIQVERGIKYYNEVYKNDSNPELSSDSCNPNNGLNKSGNTGGAGGGSGGGGGGNPGSGGGTVTIINWGCELWEFPDGNGGYYYLELNCRYTII